MVVTHNGTQYTVTRMANQYEWKLTQVDNIRWSKTMNRDQLILAGIWEQINDASLRNDSTNSAMH